MIRKSVVLPQPDGPSSTMNSPSGTVRLIPLTAGTSPPNDLTMFLASTAAIAHPDFGLSLVRPLVSDLAHTLSAAEA